MGNVQAIVGSDRFKFAKEMLGEPHQILAGQNNSEVARWIVDKNDVELFEDMMKEQVGA